MSGDETTEVTTEEASREVDGESKETPDGGDESSVTHESETVFSSAAGGDQASNSDEESETEATGAAGEESERAVDEAAESFVELEQALGHVAIDTTRGRAIDVEQVTASEVPDAFPHEITTDDALALRLVLVESGEQTVTTYFDWPEPRPGDRLSKLLALTDIPADRFADLHGTNLLLRVENGQYVPVLPDERLRGDDRAIYGIFAGILPSLLIAFAGIFGFGSLIASTTFILLWLVATFAVLPVSVYLDAWDLRTTTDWDGGPLFWSAMAMVPGLNVLTVPAYLIARENAQELI